MLNAPNASRLTRFKNAMTQYSQAWMTILRNYLRSFTRRKLFAYLLSALFTLGIVSTYPISGLAMFSLCAGMPLVLEIALRTSAYVVRQLFTRSRNRARSNMQLDLNVNINQRRPADDIVDAIWQNNAPRALEGLTNDRVANMSTMDLSRIAEEAIRNNSTTVFNRLLEIANFQPHLASRDNRLLLLAIQQRRTNMVTSLLRNQQVKDTAGAQNNLALREACSLGSLAIVEALLACPNVLADITFNNNEVVRLAENNAHWDITARLLQVDAVANFVIPSGAHLTFSPRQRIDDAFVNLFNMIMGGAGGLNQFGWLPPRDDATLEELARSRESAMTRLSEKEIRELGEIQRRYEPTLRSKGIDTILAEIRTFLIKNYENNPVIYQGKKLPIEYNNNLGTAAQKLYYANKAHTAYRYLCLRPNPWIAPNALHTDHLPNGRASTITHDQKIKIAYLWLAAADESRPAPKGFTHLQLKELFAESILAGAGRCHNYDNFVLNQRAGKEVDDNEGDKPTCSMGTAKWITQFLTIICDSPSSRPLSSSIVVNQFKTLLLAESNHKEAIFNKLNALNHDTLRASQEALENLIVVNLNDKDELEPKEKKLIEHLEFSKSAVEDMIKECKTFFGAERLTAKVRVDYQGQKFETYEALLRHLAENVLQNFYTEIDAKMTSLLKPPVASAAGKVVRFARGNQADKKAESDNEDEKLSPKKKKANKK